MSKVKSIPDGVRTLTPHLAVRNASAFIQFCENAFGAKEFMRMPDPAGAVMHAEIDIGDSRFFVAEEMPEMGANSPASLGGSPVTLTLYVEDCDAMYARALAAGATVKMPLSDMFWGDRYGQVQDPFGYTWAIVTHKEDVSMEEMAARMSRG